MDEQPHPVFTVTGLHNFLGHWCRIWWRHRSSLLFWGLSFVAFASLVSADVAWGVGIGVLIGSLVQHALSYGRGAQGPRESLVVAQDILTLQQAFEVLRQQVSATIQTSETAVFAMMERMTRVHASSVQLKGRVSEAVERSQSLSEDSLHQAGRHGQALERLASHQREFETLRQRSLERIRTVASQVRDLSPLASLIADISRQTDLISINASIEAARAGESGAGFKIVASEIRRLSAQTAQAARQITEGVQVAASGVDAEFQRLEQSLEGDSSRQLSDIAEHMQALSTTLGDVVPYLSGLSQHMEMSMKQVTEDILETLGHMQFQDINRQLLDQINNALASLSRHFAQLYQLIDGQAPPPPQLLEELLQRWSNDYVMHSQRVAHAQGIGRVAEMPARAPSESEPEGLELATANGPRIELF